MELCVVGDDYQAIYQWRGSDVSNIVTFPQRYSPVATFEIAANRRSRRRSCSSQRVCEHDPGESGQGHDRDPTG